MNRARDEGDADPGTGAPSPCAPAGSAGASPQGCPAPAAWQFDSRVEEAHEAAARVREYCDLLGYCEVERPRIELCVYEAFVNAVEHAYGSRPGLPVGLRVAVEDRQLVVRVCQRGVALDPARVAAAPSGFDDLPLDLGAGDGVPILEDRGRGLRIIKLIMDQCAVAVDGDWHCLVMRLSLPEEE